MLLKEKRKNHILILYFQLKLNKYFNLDYNEDEVLLKNLML